MQTKLKPYFSNDLLAGQSWIFIVLQAIFAILIGVFFLICRPAALIVFAILIGLTLVGCGLQCFGMMAALHRFSGWKTAGGILFLAAGIFILVHPGFSALQLMSLLGVLLLIHGIHLIISAAVNRKFRRSFRLLAGGNGVLSVLCGVAIFVSPLRVAVFIDYLFAFCLIFYGIATLVLGVRLYDIAKRG